MATERKQVGYPARTLPNFTATKITDLVSVVGRRTPQPITGSGNIALHGLVKDLTVRGTGFTAGQST